MKKYLNVGADLFKNKYLYVHDYALINDKISELFPEETISVKTLRNDLKLFRDPVNGFGAPLPEKLRIYQYSEPNFTIATKPLLPFENYLKCL